MKLGSYPGRRLRWPARCCGRRRCAGAGDRPRPPASTFPPTSQFLRHEGCRRPQGDGDRQRRRHHPHRGRPPPGADPQARQPAARSRPTSCRACASRCFATWSTRCCRSRPPSRPTSRSTTREVDQTIARFAAELQADARRQFAAYLRAVGSSPRRSSARSRARWPGRGCSAARSSRSSTSARTR